MFSFFLLLFSLSFSPLLHPLSRISLSCGYGPVWVLLAQSDLLLSLPSAPCYGCWCYGNLGDMPAPQSQGHQLHPPPPAPFSPKHPLKKVSAASCGKPRGCSMWPSKPLACRSSSCSAAFPPLVPGTAFLRANPHTRPVCARILHTKGRKVHVCALEVFEIICCKPLYHSTKALTGASVPTHMQSVCTETPAAGGRGFPRGRAACFHLPGVTRPTGREAWLQDRKNLAPFPGSLCCAGCLASEAVAMHEQIHFQVPQAGLGSGVGGAERRPEICESLSGSSRDFNMSRGDSCEAAGSPHYP